MAVRRHFVYFIKFFLNLDHLHQWYEAEISTFLGPYL